MYLSKYPNESIASPCGIFHFLKTKIYIKGQKSDQGPNETLQEQFIVGITSCRAAETAQKQNMACDAWNTTGYS